jgi:hypothetical protein
VIVFQDDGISIKILSLADHNPTAKKINKLLTNNKLVKRSGYRNLSIPEKKKFASMAAFSILSDP